MRLSDISDTKTLRAGFPDICRAIKEKETDMEVTEKNRTKYRMPGEFEPHEAVSYTHLTLPTTPYV